MENRVELVCSGNWTRAIEHMSLNMHWSGYTSDGYAAIPTELARRYPIRDPTSIHLTSGAEFSHYTLCQVGLIVSKIHNPEPKTSLQCSSICWTRFVYNLFCYSLISLECFYFSRVWR